VNEVRPFLFLSATLLFLASCGVRPQGEKTLVTPPEKLPTIADTLQIVEKVSLKIDLYLWQNFMPTVPESKPPFYLSLQVEVKNRSQDKVVGFKPTLLTLFPEGSKTPFHTFKLVSEDPQAAVQIDPGRVEYFTYTNDRSKVFSPELRKDARFYARILVVWNGKEKILSSAVVGVEFTY